MKTEQLSARAAEILKGGAVIVTGAEIRDGVMQRAQVYFNAEGEAVMDVVSKDDLVQNFPEEGVFALHVSSDGGEADFRKVVMFEGAEDMYFRTDGTHEEQDEFSGVPAVRFLETVEAICSLSLK